MFCAGSAAVWILLAAAGPKKAFVKIQVRKGQKDMLRLDEHVRGPTDPDWMTVGDPLSPAHVGGRRGPHVWRAREVVRLFIGIWEPAPPRSRLPSL